MNVSSIELSSALLGVQEVGGSIPPAPIIKSATYKHNKTESESSERVTSSLGKSPQSGINPYPQKEASDRIFLGPKKPSSVNGHSVIGASSMHRWSECPGSIHLTRNLPKVSNVYAEKGTYTHLVASDILEGKRSAEVCLLVEEPEVMEAVMVYVDLITEESYGIDPFEGGIEVSFDMSESVYPGLFGTSDAVLYYPLDHLLRVYDFKYGTSKVDVEHNNQLLYYALGALLQINQRVDTVELAVVQPRGPGEPIRRWSFPAIEILDFMANLVEAAKRTEEPDAPLKAGKWCYFCPAVTFCPEKHNERIAKAQLEFTDF